ncbi:class I SAM-dependent methyltransferase [Pseudobacteroides cellulosolvens]|uniref:Methyltransferase domain-containing protein n=1 Tax=Pseudobacteroides cellulosolvens ATCC 35603 = DSM 2933 TaxID=398512 RepID=A0A0L6JS00_9FIRM|nr:class I SAM-dependent methyltransferase [Pseudobacteroides cellulosolvens]KNY28616.1 hypothetical protein Bccel_3890 [Pseudobacteroides cellulosolvens ATCC 35603 = DSM 2933]
MQTNWKVWDSNKEYGDCFYRRAIGELPEMESSKRMAKEIKKVIKPNESILDVGCGAGHYYKSLIREIGHKFCYRGIDSTEYYINLAKKAYKDCDEIEFAVSDIYSLNFQDSLYDIVMCNNVLLHLPSIEKPLNELVRVARKHLFVRLLCGDRAFRIMDINPDKEEYNDDGEPVEFSFLNIYSRRYIDRILGSNKKVVKWSIEKDNEYNKENIVNSSKENSVFFNRTSVMEGWQINGYILMPWVVLKIEVSEYDKKI